MKTIYVVVWTPDRGELDAVARFKSKDCAAHFAALHTHYGLPCVVQIERVPTHLAQRWGVV